MLMAVSCLSPVNIQILIFAYSVGNHNIAINKTSSSVEIACGTPTCNLSSMAVAPTSIRSCSIASATFASWNMRMGYYHFSRTSFARTPPMLMFASWKFLLHRWYISSSRTRLANTSVRSPWEANYPVSISFARNVIDNVTYLCKMCICCRHHCWIIGIT